MIKLLNTPMGDYWLDNDRQELRHKEYPDIPIKLKEFDDEFVNMVMDNSLGTISIKPFSNFMDLSQPKED